MGNNMRLMGGQGLFSPSDKGQSFIPGLDARIGKGHNLCILLMGRRGDGKTALETAMLNRMLQKYRSQYYSARLYANYPVSFFRKNANGKPIDYYSPYLVEEISTFPPWFRRGYMAIDEFQSMASSRRSMSKTNVNLSAFLTQIRHRQIECIFTTQFPQVLDYQALLQVDLFVRVRTLMSYPANREGKRFPKVQELEIYDYWGQWTGLDHRKRWPPTIEDVDATRRILLPQWIGDTYDTDEIIASSYWNDGVRERVILEEHERHGGDAQWLVDMKPQMEEANKVLEDGPKQDYRDLDDLINRLPKGRKVHLQMYVATAMKLSHGVVASIIDLSVEINKYPGWNSWGYLQNNGRVAYFAEWTGMADV